MLFTFCFCILFLYRTLFRTLHAARRNPFLVQVKTTLDLLDFSHSMADVQGAWAHHRTAKLILLLLNRVFPHAKLKPALLNLYLFDCKLELDPFLTRVNDNVKVHFFHHLLCAQFTSIHVFELQLIELLVSNRISVKTHNLQEVFLSETLEVVLVLFLQKSGVRWIHINHCFSQSDFVLLEDVLFLASNNHLVKVRFRHNKADELCRLFHIVLVMSQAWLIELNGVKHFFLVNLIVIDISIHSFSSFFPVTGKARLSRQDSLAGIFACWDEGGFVKFRNMSAYEQRVLRYNLIFCSSTQLEVKCSHWLSVLHFLSQHQSFLHRACFVLGHRESACLLWWTRVIYHKRVLRTIVSLALDHIANADATAVSIFNNLNDFFLWNSLFRSFFHFLISFQILFF